MRKYDFSFNLGEKGDSSILDTKKSAFKAAFPYTVPICAGFLFLGISYGFLMSSKGFPIIYPLCMSLLIFAGSMEFVTVNLLLSTFQPISAFLLALMVNARHIFYGISMLEKFKGTGKKKWYLIFGMCDESFSINCSAKIPEGIDQGWFLFFVTLLNHIYWVSGATIGAILGNIITFHTEGIEFVLTALFLVIFLNQWMETKRHTPALIGVAASLISLLIFGPDNFMIPAMLLILAVFLAIRKRVDNL